MAQVSSGQLSLQSPEINSKGGIGFSSARKYPLRVLILYVFLTLYDQMALAVGGFSYLHL